MIFPTQSHFTKGGVVFIDVSNKRVWNALHITGAVHLSWERHDDPRLSRTTLREVVGYDDEIAFYADYDGDGVWTTAAWEAAKAVAWGYRKVYHFVGGGIAWEDAGYPIETGQ